MMADRRFMFDSGDNRGLGEQILRDASHLKLEMMVIDGRLAVEFDIKGCNGLGDSEDPLAVDAVSMVKQLLERFQEKAKTEGGDDDCMP